MLFPVSAEIEERYWKEEQDHIVSQVRNAQHSRIKKALKQANKKIKSLQENLQKAERYREYGRYGELLKGQLHSLTKGQAFVTVIDYYDPALPQLTLPLDSSKDPVWNMEDYFRKYHRNRNFKGAFSVVSKVSKKPPGGQSPNQRSQNEGGV